MGDGKWKSQKDLTIECPLLRADVNGIRSDKKLDELCARLNDEKKNCSELLSICKLKEIHFPLKRREKNKNKFPS